MDRLKVIQRKMDDDRHFIITDGIREFRFSIDENFGVLLHLTTSDVKKLTLADYEHKTKIVDLFED